MRPMKLSRKFYYKTVDKKKINYILDTLYNGLIVGKQISIHDSVFMDVKNTKYTVVSMEPETMHKVRCSIPHVGTFYTYYHLFNIKLIRSDGELDEMLLSAVDYSEFPKHDFYVFTSVGKRHVSGGNYKPTDKTKSIFIESKSELNFKELFFS